MSTEAAPDLGRRSVASPYSTGGGGVVLEHVYGATLLADMLVGVPLDLLGDELSIEEVAFQAGHTSPVDDLLVTGSIEGSPPVPRRVAIAVRRDPTMAPSDADFVRLVAAMLQAVDERWDEVVAGTWRLGLVVAGPHTGAREVATLTEFARSHPHPERFRAAVAAPRATKAPVRTRLRHLDGVVRDALNQVPREQMVEELTWRLLFALRVVAVQCEGDVATDRSACVARLQAVVTDATSAAALFEALVGLAGRYAPSAAEVDSAKLRRDLVGTARVAGSLRHRGAWSVLGRLGTRARSRVGTSLVSDGTNLEIDRSSLKDGLRTTLLAAPAGTSLIVTGDPDVGKSALTIAVADELVSEGAAVHLLNLREVPRQALELEHALGGSLVEVLGSGPVADVRALVVDGAEAALEGWADVFSDLVDAARRAGLLVVGVTRNDAAGAVERSLADDGQAVPRFVVPALEHDQRERVAMTFPGLSRFSDDARAEWLLGRPGLVDLVLRAGIETSLPGGALCEAHILLAVWARLVRCDERHGPGDPSPDGREQALLALAERALTRELAPVADLGVLPSLRSDGLLLPAGPASAWAGGDQFASDLVRDFALAWLFLVNGFGALKTANAPRWAVRAAVLAAQARLVKADKVVVTREELQAEVDEIARDHGDRWSELVDEATLTLGSSAVLDEVWPSLLAKDGSGLERALRVVAQRYTVNSMANPLVAAPVVDVYLARVKESAVLPSEPRKSAEGTVIAYLRGLALERDDRSDPVRVAVRERALTRPDGSQEVEALGLLGADLDDRADEALRQVAADRPYLLDDVVESTASVVSMANHRPALLLHLAEEYYVEREHPGRSPFTMSLMDDGVRRHTRMGVGFPFAGWWAGPFWMLLRACPLETLGFVNRMLDHAAQVRVRSLRSFSGDEPAAFLEVDLPRLGRRALAGDSHVWSWYRGTTVGPYPCISALLAVEKAADSWYEAGVSLEVVVDRLLEGCNNLAMLGLVVGFLVRHLDEVTTELDVFLAQPALWELEFGRMVGELGGLRAQREDPEVFGADKRRYSLADVAGTLTASAIVAGDTARVAELEELADRLVANATREDGSVDPTVHMWASVLRASRYEATRLEDGRVALRAKPAPEVEAAMASRQAEMALGNEGYRLLNTYARDEERRPTELSRLVEDVAVARQLAQNPPAALGRTALDAAVAVAAVALVAHGQGQVHLSWEDLEWAAVEVVGAIAPRSSEGSDFSGSWYSPGADRSAAVALPSLLLPAFNEDSADEASADEASDEEAIEAIREALTNCATSDSDEVRRFFGASLAPVWGAPCHDLVEGQCRHDIALGVVEEGLRDCRLGPWRDQRREPLVMTGNLEAELASVGGGDLLLERLTGPIVALSAAARGTSCVAGRAESLLEAVLGAYRRALVAWSASGYSIRDEGQVPVVMALLDLQASGRAQVLNEHVGAMVDDPAALWLLLRLLAQVATYDQDRRHVVFDAWPGVARAVLDQIGCGRDPRRTGARRSAYRRPYAMGALVLRPQLKISDNDPDATLAGASSDWAPLGTVRPTIEEWLPLVVGSPEALDDLIGYLRTLTYEEQVDPGLTWVTTIISGDHNRFAGRSFFVAAWLSDVRVHVQDEAALQLFRGIIDGLVNAGDDRLVPVQRAEEDGA